MVTEMRDVKRIAGPRAFFVAALSVLSMLILSTVSAAEVKEPSTPEVIWQSFVKHLDSIGRSDLVPTAVDSKPHDEHKDGDTAQKEDDDGDDHHGHDHSAGAASGKDPIAPIVHQLSKELARLQTLFEDADDPLLRTLPAQEREAKARKLLKALETHKDPYVQAYGHLYEARAALDRSEPESAISTLKKLDGSSFFLGHRELHRLRARAYRAIGDDSLALLELRLFALELDDSDRVERTRVEEEITEIRKTNVGPLRESAKDARSASILIEQRSRGEDTRESQERVAEILDRALRLLGESTENVCCKASAAGKPCEPSCKKRQVKVGLAGQRRVEGILDGIIDLLETSCKACNSKADKACKECKKKTACKKCGSCKSCESGSSGNGDLLAQGAKKKPGSPSKQKPGDTPAKDSKFPRGKPDQKYLRDVDHDSKEIWGQINDREVARSLRELWGKVPVAYRGLVAQYFLDITELAPESSK